MTMLNKRLLTATGAIGILLASIMPTVASAGGTAYNNLGTPTADNYPFSYTSSQSNSFTALGGGLTSVSLLLGQLSSGSGSGKTLTINLLNDSGNNTPGSILGALGTLGEDLLSTTLSVFTFNNFAPIQLTAGTRYWINVISDAGANSTAGWAYAVNDSGIGVQGEYNSNIVDGTSPNSAIPPYQMQVTIPEPGTLALISVGLVGVSFGKRRRSP